MLLKFSVLIDISPCTSRLSAKLQAFTKWWHVHRKGLSLCYGLLLRMYLYSFSLIDQWLFTCVCSSWYHDTVFKCSTPLVILCVQIHRHTSFVSVSPYKLVIIPLSHVKSIYNTTHWNSVLFFRRVLMIISVCSFCQLRSTFFELIWYAKVGKIFFRQTNTLSSESITNSEMDWK